MLDEKEVSDILNKLVSEDKLTVREDLIYFYKEVESQKTNPIFLEYHPKEESEFILKCYCIGVKTEQCAFLLGIGDATAQKYNMYFRKIIYQNQLAELKKYFNKKPKLPKMRTFYDTEVYFYMYDNAYLNSENKDCNFKASLLITFLLVNSSAHNSSGHLPCKTLPLDGFLFK